MSNKFEIQIDPVSEDYDPNDDRWIEQIDNLLTDCKREAGDIRMETTPEEGKKGGFDAIFLLLDSSQAIGYAFDIFKAWVMRDRTRSLKIKINDGKNVKELELSGKGFKKEDLEKYMAMAMNMQSAKDE